jgi:hypothetical protein
LLLGSGHAAEGQNLLPNGTFDTGMDGWIAPPGGSGAIEWDPSFGQPPGSLRVVGNDDVAVPELCFLIPPQGADYYWHADVYMDASDEFFLCSINYALYDTPDCSDSFAFVVGDENAFPWVRTKNQWEHLNFDGKNVHFGVGGTFKSVRPFVSKLADIGSADACVLDNAYFEIVPLATPSIPTLSPVGLVLLAALLALAALVVLRRTAS